MPTTIKDAIKIFEEKAGQPATEAERVRAPSRRMTECASLRNVVALEVAHPSTGMGGAGDPSRHVPCHREDGRNALHPQSLQVS